MLYKCFVFARNVFSTTIPFAISGWIGLILLGICSFVFALNGVFYAKCWEMLIERYPNYREHVRDPLPIIAEEALGHTVR